MPLLKDVFKGGGLKINNINDRKFLKLFGCSRLALRNHPVATQKTNFMAEVSLFGINQLHQSTAISSDSKSPSTSDTKTHTKNKKTEKRSHTLLQ